MTFEELFHSLKEGEFIQRANGQLKGATAAGTPRPPGANGQDGATGAQGPAGADGAQGQQGIQGIQGIQGVQGPEGPEGPPGAGGDPLDAWPVGAVYISVVSTSPATLFGGTWAAFGTGRVLVGIDAGQTEFDAVEETGGAKTHTLTETEIPSHTHVQNSHNHIQDAHTHVQNAHNHGLSEGQTDGAGSFMDRSNAASATTSVTDNATAVNQNATATNQAATAVNQNTGGGGAHNNLQPYIVVHMWKRTA